VKISREKIVLFLGDLLALNLAYIASYWLRYETGWFRVVSVAPEFRHLFVPSLLVSGGWLLIFLLRGMYRTLYGQNPVDILFNVIRASLVGVFIIFLITIDLRQPLSPSRVVLMSYWGFLIFFVAGARIIIRLVQRRLLSRGIGLRNALILGFNDRAKAFLRQIQRVPDMGLNICGFLNGGLDEEYLGVKVVAGMDGLEPTVRQLGIREVILAPSPSDREGLPNVISRLANLRVGVKMLPDLTDTLYGPLRTAAIRGVPLIDVFPDILSPGERSLKRAIDILISVIVLLPGLPFLLLIALGIRLDTPGPILYVQPRIGRGGRTFTLYKFRSMVHEAEVGTGPIWAEKDDPRITRFGRFMRKLHLDELPQFINVLKGDMSLVGPRPERPSFVEQFRQTIPLYERRLNVKPGITGWAQVKHKYDESLTDVMDKLRYDLFYLENMSLALDLKIILSTVGVILSGKGH
jgi:exopolysaccharide biosynthesis polyprenyl glycosylphosphotransferase